MQAIHGACSRRELPFVSVVHENKAHNCHHIEITSGRMTVHVTRTDGPSSMPSDTALRNDKRLSNQGDLFDLPPNVVRLGEPSRYYGWLTFGADANGLTHVCLGMPCDKGRDWLDRINLLKELGHSGALPAGSGTSAEPDAATPKPVFGLKESVRKQLEKREGQGDARKDGSDGTDG